MSYYAVIDTNVVVSSMLKQKSIPWQILDFVDKGIIVPLLNEEIVNEYVTLSQETNSTLMMISFKAR